MRIVDTSQTKPSDLNPWEREQIYNGLDCCLTGEILDALLPQLDNHTSATYNFSRALQGPALEMRLRGVLVDQQRKATVIEDYFNKIETLSANLERIVFEGVGLPHFNWRSNSDLQTLFYDRLQIPPIRRGGRPTVNREALEKLEQYIIARQIVKHIIAMRDLGKKIAMLKTEIDPDGRIRTSYNIAGTSTGRFSSSFSEFGTGGNLQNVEESLRSVFVSDPGYKFAKFDAKQIQSRIVGGLEWNIFHDGTYLDACESRDVHTFVAKLMWPHLGWTDDPIKDKEIAETDFYRHYTYRSMCKKIGHAANFEGKADTLSSQSKIPINLVRDFLPKYYKAFPRHLDWHDWVDSEIRRTGTLISLTGRKRYFWGRRGDSQTNRDAIAYCPQADESFIVGQAMLRIWQDRTAMLMFHDHDALTFQYPEAQEDIIVPKLIKQLEYPVRLKHGRILLVPYDAKVGWNKGDWSEENPDGLKDYTGHDQRRRTPKVSLLDRKLR